MNPTLALLRDKRRLRVSTPEAGEFEISLREVFGVLGVRVYHDGPPDGNPYRSRHRIMSAERIENWLSDCTLL
jgi:hypothetical protein